MMMRAIWITSFMYNLCIIQLYRFLFYVMRVVMTRQDGAGPMSTDYDHLFSSILNFYIYTQVFFLVLYDDFGGGRLNSPERFFLKKEKKLWRERKCILQPFFLVCCVFLSIGKRFFRQISSKGRDGPRGLVDSCTELNSTASIDDPKLLLFSLSTTTLENDFNDHSIRFQYQRIRNPMSDIFK